jgi:lipopolysaccharide/colanic/teichoic acid biosynthesis glycosyltransferase
VKRLFDIIASAVALLLLSPLLLAAAIAVALETGLPVIFKQTRIGKGCQPFGMYKFRSMVKDAATQGPHFTNAGDPRITRVGRFIRKTSIDELPQLINVLKGDMSLVGPRPDVPAQQEGYRSEDWQERHTVRPGITGLAQAELRSAATTEQRLALDLQYVRSHSLAMDCRILWRTVARLSGRGST